RQRREGRAGEAELADVVGARRLAVDLDGEVEHLAPGEGPPAGLDEDQLHPLALLARIVGDGGAIGPALWVGVRGGGAQANQKGHASHPAMIARVRFAMVPGMSRWRARLTPAVAFLAITLAICWRLWTPIKGERKDFAWDTQWEYWGDLQFQLDAYRDGELPLWNPYDRAG